jgi:hypothetical protein
MTAISDHAIRRLIARLNGRKLTILGRCFIPVFGKFFFIALSMSPHAFRAAFVSLMGQKKTGTEFSVAGFTICSLIPVVTTLGYQFIASTSEGHSSSLLGIFPAVPTAMQLVLPRAICSAS